MINFPFNRNQDYPIVHLLAFEARLLNTRRSDPTLSNILREPTNGNFPWIKLRHEELLPLIYCVGHGKFSRDVTFRIMPDGDPIDLQIYDDGKVTKLQFTVADPKWGSTRRGSQHHLHVWALNTGKCTSGFGPYREANGVVSGRASALSGNDLDCAYGDGLKEALARKSGKVGPDTILVVFCRGFGEAMDASRFYRLVQNALSSFVEEGFSTIWFIDYLEGIFFEHQRS